MNTTIVPRDLRRSEPGTPLVRSAPMEVVMSMQRDHHVLESEAGAVWPALWVGAAVVAIVALSYWLNMM